MMKFSVIVPCYNEAENIEQCVLGLRNLYQKAEIIVVDDGSDDNLSEIVKNIESVNVVFVSLPQNKGKTAAVKAGIKQASNDVVVIFDADMTTGFDEIMKICKPVINGECGFAYGSRFCLPMEKKAMRFINRFGNRLAAFCLSTFSGQKISDVLCGTKAFRKDQFKDIIFENGKWPDFDLLSYAIINDLGLVEIPVAYYARKHGKSKMRVRACFDFVKDMLVLRKKIKIYEQERTNV